MSNTITQGLDKELTADGDGVIARGPASAKSNLAEEVSAASQLKTSGQPKESLALSDIQSRTDLRLAATNEAMRADPQRVNAPPLVEKDVAKQWADLDASEFARMRSPERKEVALESIAANMRVSPEYTQEIKTRSPVIAEAASYYNDSLRQLDSDRQQAIADSLKNNELEAKASARLVIMDAASMAALTGVRKEQTEAVSILLSRSPDAPTLAEVAAARRSVVNPPLDGRITAPNDPDMQARDLRAIKRPVSDQELSESIRQRFIITTEKKGLLDKGRTDFTFRGGDLDGRVAFSDSGKSLTTSLEDKATVRVMVEVAMAKNWKEITVNGTDDFRRVAWLEARSNGLEVRGYEPREADKQALAELVKRNPPTNAIVLDQRELRHSPEPAAESVSRGKQAANTQHIDGDSLTPRQAAHVDSVLESHRSVLAQKKFAPEFIAAALEAEKTKLVNETMKRGERVYIGEVVEHGRANYKFDEKNDPSYFVTLKTSTGEQTVWGKNLESAMNKPEASVGQSIVLKNTGKEPVTVTETMRDAQGREIGTRLKGADKNGWSAEPLPRHNDRADGATGTRQAQLPTMGVYDSRAERTQSQSQAARTDQANDRNPIVQRPGRDR
jgi:hypothetical protein